MLDTYRKQFANSDEPQRYDEVEYEQSSYSALLWEVEKDQLREILSTIAPYQPDCYLDFASGTGRVISFMEKNFKRSHGIEISPYMIEIARKKVSHSNFFCVDITAGGDGTDIHVRKYDVITAFRFILNAEPALRQDVFSILPSFLKSSEGLMIINNHGNLLSHKLLLWPYHFLKGIGKSYTTSGNYMTHSAVVKLLDQNGLRIVKRMGAGFLSAKVLKFLPFESALRIEKNISRSFLNRLCVNQMYVVSRKE